MRYELVALIAAAFVVGVGTTTLIPAATFAAESVCEMVQDADKKAECVAEEAIAEEKCATITDATASAECVDAEAAALEEKFGQ